MKREVAVLTLLVAVPFIPAVARADSKAECIAASEKAQQLKDDRKLIKAREQLLVCGRDVCPGPVRKDCADMLQQVDSRLPSVVVRAKGKNGEDLVDVKVTADGNVLTEKLDGRAISLDPGVHAFHFETAGADPIDQSVVVGEGEQNRALSVQFGKPPGEQGTPATTSKGVPVGAFVVIGVGVLAAGVGAPIFYAMGLNQKSVDEAPGGCKPNCSAAEVDSIRTKLIVGDIFMGVGVAAVIGGTIWAIVHYTGGKKEASAPPAARFDLTPTFFLGGGGGASATLRF